MARRSVFCLNSRLAGFCSFFFSSLNVDFIVVSYMCALVLSYWLCFYSQCGRHCGGVVCVCKYKCVFVVAFSGSDLVFLSVIFAKWI